LTPKVTERFTPSGVATLLGVHMDVLRTRSDAELPDGETKTLVSQHDRVLAMPPTTYDRLCKFSADEDVAVPVTLLSAYFAAAILLAGTPDHALGYFRSGPDGGVILRVASVDADDRLSFRKLTRLVANLLQSTARQRYVRLGQSEGEADAWFLFGPAGSAQGAPVPTLACNETADGLGIVAHRPSGGKASPLHLDAAEFAHLVGELTAEPDRSIAVLVPALRAARERFLCALNPYRRPRHRFRTITEPFEEQVRRTPAAVAIEDEHGKFLTYAELNAQANRLARYLRQVGADRGTRVALALDRSIAQFVAVHAVAKSGAAYVPLETDLPDDRLAFILDDTEPLLILADAATSARLPAGGPRVVDVSQDASAWAELPDTDFTVSGPEHHLLHLLYTSGSTGRPKGVAYPVDGAIANIFWLQRSYPFGPGDVALFKTSYGFDVSIWELFWPLYFGARVVICRPGGHRDPRHLVELMDRHGVTTVFLIPTLMQPLLEHLSRDRCTALRWVFCGGEPVTPRIRDTFHQRSSAALINCYGPTEAGCVTDMVLPPDPGSSHVPLGRPAEHFRLYVLDEDLRISPTGSPGEAYLGGEVGVAQSYWRRPDQTAERFLPDPYGPPGSRMYRTGDLCRYQHDGVLDHLGRADRQVKIRGMRIEPAEVEAVVAEHASVADCVVLPVGEDPRLVAFAVPAPQAILDAHDVLAHAAKLLPQHMRPEQIVEIPAVPATVNGKTDQRALLAAWEEAGDDEREVLPPRDAFDEHLIDLYRRVLGTERIGLGDNFVELGGHSMLAFSLIELCVAELGTEPDVTDLLTATIGELADRMRSGTDAAGSHLVGLFPRPDKPVLVLIHAVSGSAAPFVPVARCLRDAYSVYALQVTDRTPAPIPETIEEFADRYLALVDPLRHERPLVLAGWSMGGCVALEMARRWRSQGFSPARVVLLDTLLPPPALGPVPGRDQARAAILAMDIVALEGGEPGDGAQLRELLNRNRLTFLDYLPAPFDGPVTFLRASEDFAGADALPASYATADRGWQPFVDRLTVGSIPGTHFTLLSESYAESLSKHFLSITE